MGGFIGPTYGLSGYSFLSVVLIYRDYMNLGV